jgi:DNA-binding NarL/FixJ family response regulator
MAEQAIRVLIADDHSIVRKGIRAVLAVEEDIVVVGEAGDGQQAINQAEKLRPDVVLMDLMMPKLDGLEATRQVAARKLGARVLVLTSFEDDDKVFPAIKAGALGYLLKDSDSEDLGNAIRQVYHGKSTLDPSIARKVLRELSHEPVQPPIADQLTDREFAVLKLLAKGLSNREIADRLVVSQTTVHTHVSNILSKLHLATRTRAALFALREGIASLDECAEHA